MGNVRFNEHEFTGKLIAKIDSPEVNKKQSAELANFVRSNFNLVLKNKDGDEIVDYKSRSSKYPIIYKRASDGKRYKTSVEFAKLKFSA